MVVLAQEEARVLKHDYIGTEHILLALIHEGEGVAAKALEALGIKLDGVRGDVERVIGKGHQAPSGHIPFTPRAKKVLELCLREALQLGHNYIGTEHILLGLIREGEGVACQILVKRGAELTRVRQQVIQLLSGYQGKSQTSPDLYAGDLDNAIAEARRQKEAAIDACDFEAAASFREQEKQLIAQRGVTDKTTASNIPPSIITWDENYGTRLQAIKDNLVYRIVDPISGEPHYYPLVWQGAQIQGIDFSSEFTLGA